MVLNAVQYLRQNPGKDIHENNDQMKIKHVA